MWIIKAQAVYKRAFIDKINVIKKKAQVIHRLITTYQEYYFLSFPAGV